MNNCNACDGPLVPGTKPDGTPVHICLECFTKTPKNKSGMELAQEFALALSDVLGLQKKGLLSFCITAGDPGHAPLVTVTATYVVPQGAGEAAATLIRQFGMVPGEVTLQEGAPVDRSTPLTTGFETTHRAVPPACPDPTEASDCERATESSRSQIPRIGTPFSTS